MTTANINTEIKEVKNTMDLLMACVEDKNNSIADRNNYYKEYLIASKYYLELNRTRPEHKLSIA